MDTNKMREQFEAWARSRSMDLEYRNIPGVGQFYECPRTLLASEAWQASREAVSVEMPEYLDTDRIGFAAYCAAEVEAAIEACGLRIKP
ncbi:hypothetical protein D3C81_1659140 [compost metagenome]